MCTSPLTRIQALRVMAVVGVIGFALLGSVDWCWADDKAEAEQLVERARETLQNFRQDASFADWKEHYRKAAGFLIYPSLVRGGLILGGSGGTGVLIVKDEKAGWLGPAFYTIGGGSLGLLAGFQVSEVLVLVTSDRGVTRLLTTGAKVGTDSSVAAGEVSAGAGSSSTDLVAVSLSRGLYAGMSLEGAVVAVRDALNRAYYGRAVRPAEILGGAATNPQADGLKKAATALAEGK